jgi:hypothetical protein
MGKSTSQAQTQHASKGEALWANVVSPVGYVLAVSYPILALSTGVRAVYQLFFKSGVENYLPVYLSALAALLYLVAALGFAYRRRWTWWLSVAALGVETLMTFIIGLWSFVDPELIGRTVWRHFGEDYGYFPLFQPLFGLVWLFWPLTMAAYGIRKPSAHHAEKGTL